MTTAQELQTFAARLRADAVILQDPRHDPSEYRDVALRIRAIAAHLEIISRVPPVCSREEQLL